MYWGKSTIKRPANNAKSLAVVVWPGSVKPSGFLNAESFMPKALACSFINVTKRSTLPATPSANATVASLPDCTIMPRSKSSTGTFILGSMNMREPGIFQARVLTGKVCSRLIFLLLRASNTR